MWKFSWTGRHPEATRDGEAGADLLFVVSTAQGIDQVFARGDDADQYASEVPGASVSRYVLRRSLAEAVAVFDRWIVVADGKVKSERSSWVRQFVDDPRYAPAPADVEWFRGDQGDDWHVAGFGTDEAELEATMRAAVKQACRASATASPERAR